MFVHINDLKYGKRIPAVGEPVSYIESKDKKNRSCAKQVVFLNNNISTTKMKLKSILILFSALFLSGMAISVVMDKLPAFVLIIYAVMSLATFFMYWLDKSAARKNTWRTKENTLQLMALMGGWPGALIGQQLFRHKSKKTPFQIMFWLLVIVNLGLIVWLHTLQAKPYLNAVQSFIDSML